MAETETGWTKEWPKANGYYWRRMCDPIWIVSTPNQHRMKMKRKSTAQRLEK